MKKLKWWFLILGVWYLLLALMNLYMMFLGGAQGQKLIIDTIPFPADEWVVRAFVDGWSPFLFDMIGIATFCLWASRSPHKYLGAVWLLVWLELLHGILDDMFLIARGYDAASYIGFSVIHLLIIVSGVLVARQAQAETMSNTPNMTTKPSLTD